MDFSLIQFIFLLLLSALYLAVIVFALRRGEKRGNASLSVAAYGLIALTFSIVEAFWRKGNIASLDASAFINLFSYGAALLSFGMLLTARMFLRRSNWRMWFGIGIAWALGWTLFVFNAFPFPGIIWSAGAFTLKGSQLGRVWSALGWLMFNFSAIWILFREYRQTQQTLYRNRLSFWIPVFSFVTINDIALFLGTPLYGNILRLAASAIMAYVVLTHRLPDMRRIVRETLVYIMTTLLVMVFYLAGLAFMQEIFRAAPDFDSRLSGAFVALALALIFTPLLGLVRNMLNAWMKTDQYDPGRMLHEYSESVSNVLDMQRLASVAVGIIVESMQVQRGFLFLVDQGHRADVGNVHVLRPVRSPEERTVPILELDEKSPIAVTLTGEARPLLQYDLDLLPLYQTASSREREWFKRLNAEVYVPIFSKRKWIGLLAIGSKVSGHRFTEEDLVTISALANQTAVALENARLVDNLVRLNDELRKARREQEKTNRDLQRLDETKSDFISIASHELRTPLTVIKGYVEMLLEDPRLDSGIVALIKKIHDGTLRMHEIMESMFDIAQINASTRELRIQRVDMGEILMDAYRLQNHTIRERKMGFSIELPALPKIKADPSLLEKMFYHLIRNAVKFTPDGGRIAVTGSVTVPTTSEFLDGAVEITVSDTGVGVDPNFKELIFTKFYQPGDLGKHSTSKSRFQGGGTGLGLALCKGIVDAHGGRIWVESPGYDEINFPGSHFNVLLPLPKLEADEQREMGKEVSFSVGLE